MKILLINPHEKNIVRTSFPMSVDRHTGIFPPLNLLYIASYVNSSKRHTASVVDIVSTGAGFLDNKMKSFEPDIVGIRAISFNVLSALDVASYIKDKYPGISVILGGPHPSVFPQESLGYPDIDYAVSGEGEEVILKLLDYLKEDKPLDQIPGLAYRGGKGIVFNGSAPEIENIDHLPFPDRRLVNYKKHFNILSNRSPSTTAFSGRGCVHACSFCYHSFGRRARLRSPENVVEEMKEISNLGIKDIFFVDDAFTLDRKRVLDICMILSKLNLDLSWAVKSRVDAVDEELLEIMKKAGLRRIHFGVESASQKTLDTIDKGVDIEMSLRAVRTARKAGIKIMADFIIGAPGEKYSDVLESIRFAIELDPDFALFNVAMPYPGTEMYLEGVKAGVFNDFWKDFAENPADNSDIRYWDELISPIELEALLKKANKSFYIRPGYIMRSLTSSGSPKMLCRKARLALSIISL